jgi:iron complex transport system substrate-binding protein
MIADPDRRALVATGLTALLGAAACGKRPASPSSSPSPRRIVSVNPCLDVILLEVADRPQITALSHYSRDRYSSTVADLARTLPFTRGTAEEIIALSPDLVLTGPGQTRVETLDRLHIRSAVLSVPETVDASLAQVREVAALVGHPQRGEALVRRIEAALAASAPPPGAPALSALVFMPGGFASGPGSLMDEMMKRAGFRNAAARYGLRHSMSVPLEQVIADPPDVLLSGEPWPGAPSWAERVMEHPALNHLAPRHPEGGMSRATFPERLLFCGGPVLIQTAAALSRARDQVLASRT